MSAGLLSPVVITVILSACLFAQEKPSSAGDFESESHKFLVPERSGSADAQSPPAPPSSTTEDRWKDPSAWQTTIYPVFAWAPVFGISTRELPSSPGGGGGGL